MKLPILTAADGAGWGAGLLVALERGDHGVAVVRRCVDVVDLLAAAGAGQAKAALVAAGLRRLDADAVDRLNAAGVVPVGVVRRADGTAEDRLRAMGIEFLVPDDAEPGVVGSVISEAVAVADGGTTRLRLTRTFGDPATATSQVIPPMGTEPAPGQPTRRGSVVAVWGPTGAPGRTTVAVALADELSRLGCTALLVDADVYGGVIASVLGCSTNHPASPRRAGKQRRPGWTRRRSPGCAGNSGRRCGCSPASHVRNDGRNCARPRSGRCWARPAG